MTRSTEKRLILLSSSLAIILLSLFIFDSELRTFPRDPYWRYQGNLWAQVLVDGFGSSPFPNHSKLLSWTNNFKRDILSPYIVSMLHLILDTEIGVIYSSPLLIVPFIFSIAIVSKVLLDSRKAALIALVLAVGFRFRYIHLLDSVHRVTLGAIFLLLIVFLGQRVHDSNQRKRIFLLFILVNIAFVRAYSTLALTGTLFLLLYFGIQELSSKENGRYRVPLFTALVIMLFYAFINSWIFSILQSLLPAIYISIQQGTIHSALAAPTPPSSNESLTLLQKVSSDLAYTSSFLLISSAFIFRMTNYYRSSGSYRPCMITKFDAFLLSSSILIFLEIFLTQMYAPSGGIDPIYFGLLITPIVGSYSIIKIYDVLNIGNLSVLDTCVIIVILMLVSPGIIATQQEITHSSKFPTTFTESDEQLLSWAETRLPEEDRVLSDFHTLSAFYYQNPKSRQASVVPSATSSNSTFDGLQGIYTLFYDQVSRSSEVSDSYMVSSVMLEDKLFFLGGVSLSPNPLLDDQLSNSTNHHKVYSAKQGYIFKSEEPI